MRKKEKVEIEAKVEKEKPAPGSIVTCLAELSRTNRRRWQLCVVLQSPTLAPAAQARRE